MKKERKDKDFIKSPYYAGGKSALEAFVKKELRYPKEALAAKVEGTVSVRYTVDFKGHIMDAHVISGIGHGCDEEALRIVNILQFKVPNDGKIKSKYTRKLHIHFRLPGSPSVLPATKNIQVTPQNSQMSFQYQIISKPVKVTVAPAKKSISYDIKINIPPKENS
ncbi:MAG: energy transducer TonB [Saprospiraceae bacterium]